VTDTLGNTTAYTYDAAGNRASVTDPAGHVTRYTYDAGRRLLTQSSDVSSNGVTTTVAMTNTYTPLNELANRTDADGRTMSYSYDGGGQLTGVIVQYLIKSATPLFSFLHGNADTFGEVFKTSAKMKELYEYTEKLKEANELPVVEAVSTLYGSTDTSGKSNPILTGVLKVSVCTLGHHLSELREGLLEYTCTKATTGLLPFLIDSDSIGLNLVAYALVKELQVVTAQYAVSLPNNGVFVNEDFNSFVGQVIRLDIGKLGRSEEGGVIGLATTAAALELAYYSLPVLIIDTLPEASTGAVMPPDFIPGKSAKGGGGHEGGSGGE